MQKVFTVDESIVKAVPSIFLIVCLVGLPQLSETIYSPALPTVTTALKTTSHLVQWSLSIYFIGFALGVAFWGKLSDHTGRRLAILAGLVIYFVSSIVCGSSPNITTLLIARFFQAFGISVGSVITQSIMRDCFDGVERNKIFSIAGMAIALAPALGPVLGGLLTDYISWRANFSCLTLLGMAMFLYSYVRLPETYQYNKPITHQLSLPFTAMFVRMLKDKHVLASALLVGAFNGILFAYYSAAPYIFIEVYQMTPQHFGWLGLFMAMGVCIGSLLSHRLNHLIDTIKLITSACAVNLLAMALFLFLVYFQVINVIDWQRSIVLMMLCMMTFYMCFGIAIPNILSKALVNYQANIGAAGSMFGLIYYVWVAFFIFGIGLFIPHSLYLMPGYFFLLSLIIMLASFKLTAFKN